MGRLTNLKPQLGSLRPSVAYMPEGDREHDRFRNTQPWRKWYSLKRWKELRWSILVRDHFTCQRCGKLEGNTSQLVANHKTPHKGNEALFWFPDNLETACKPCHDGLIQREERRAEAGGA